MFEIHFPRPLRQGHTIAITAPSSGVPEKFHARLDIVIHHIANLGFNVVTGACLRDQKFDQSADSHLRAAELSELLVREDIDAIFPPWGGERSIELLSLLDWDLFRRVRPKWLLGYSDITTLALPLLLSAGWASAHCTNLMDFGPNESEPLTVGTLGVLGTPVGESVTQYSSELHQGSWSNYAEEPRATLNLIHPTQWKALRGVQHATLKGRLIGGCLDTISRLTGCGLCDVPGFIRQFRDDGVLLYFENSSYAPNEMLRAIWSLRLCGWLEGLNGILIGRNNGPDGKGPLDMNFELAIEAALGDLPMPVLFDLDIGHRPPQFTLVNGALATVEFSNAAGSVTQTWGK